MNCTYCGAPDTPVRQIPVYGVPASECYCDRDECYDACVKMYGGPTLDRSKIVYGYVVGIPDPPNEGNDDDE